MSDTLRCNFCSLEEMRKRAEQRGTEVIIEPKREGWIPVRYADEQAPHHWFLALTEECVC